MYKDKIIIKPEHTKKARLIAATINMRYLKSSISISGAPGTGKTEVAIEAKRMLGDYDVYSLDAYYFLAPEKRGKSREYDLINNIGVTEINWEKLRLDIGNKRKYIVEGLYASFLTLDLCVHLEGTLEQTYSFRKERFKEDPDNDLRKIILDREYEEVQRLTKSTGLKIGFNYNA